MDFGHLRWVSVGSSTATHMLCPWRRLGGEAVHMWGQRAHGKSQTVFSFIFNWMKIALWCCVGFCQTTWISHRYINVCVCTYIHTVVYSPGKPIHKPVYISFVFFFIYIYTYVVVYSLSHVLCKLFQKTENEEIFPSSLCETSIILMPESDGDSRGKKASDQHLAWTETQRFSRKH